MANYLFYPAADKAQDGIWVYGCDEWGEAQAEKYIRDLHLHLQELADKQVFWHKLPDRLVIPVDLSTCNISSYK
ncbi:MAG: type II toxin-antitoxin system RelE/ParE family toxin, partial [Gammaproteobacteria bacterium]|nr:type II toxin-antitoxin system RelE/ParE family toxin [Gammaproteobacteria bacterium]